MKKGNNRGSAGQTEPEGSSGVPPEHPGGLLRSDFFIPSGLSEAAFARRIGLGRSTVSRFMCCKHPILKSSAAKIQKACPIDGDSWFVRQARYYDSLPQQKPREPPDAANAGPAAPS